MLFKDLGYSELFLYGNAVYIKLAYPQESYNAVSLTGYLMYIPLYSKIRKVKMNMEYEIEATKLSSMKAGEEFKIVEKGRSFTGVWVRVIPNRNLNMDAGYYYTQDNELFYSDKDLTVVPV